MISTSSWRQRKSFLAILEYTVTDFTEHMVEAIHLYIRSSDWQLPSREQLFLFLQLHCSFGVLLVAFFLACVFSHLKYFRKKRNKQTQNCLTKLKYNTFYDTYLFSFKRIYFYLLLYIYIYII